MYKKHNLYRSSFLLVICAAFFISSCGLFGGENEKPSGDLMPLAVGNYWEYEFTYIWKDTLRYEVSTEIEVPVGDTSYTAYAANFLPFPPGASQYYWLYRNAEEGLYQMGGMAETDTLMINEIDKLHAAEEGQTWEVPQLAFSRDSLKFYVSDTLSITLIDNDREIVTPAGQFECYVYKFPVSNGNDVPKWDYFMYYSPGVGLVAQIATSEGEPKNIKEEMYLMNYRVQ